MPGEGEVDSVAWLPRGTEVGGSGSEYLVRESCVVERRQHLRFFLFRICQEVTSTLCTLRDETQ
jgi:hypothetical protein